MCGLSTMIIDDFLRFHSLLYAGPVNYACQKVYCLLTLYTGALFVKNDCLREGIGRRLINYVKERYSYLSLNVYEKNIDATLFYVAMGFKNTKIQIDEATRRKGICYGVEK